MITNLSSGTNVHEIAAGIYRINTPVTIPGVPEQFSFNQYFIVDEEPLLFHTGPRRMFPWVREAIGKVMPVERLRYVGLSHFEADECGSLNDFLEAAPRAEPVCSAIAAMTSISDLGLRAPRALADGELLSLGAHKLRWFDTPHVPHGWECGLMMETSTEHVTVRGPVHAGRRGREAAGGDRHPRAERAVSRTDGLLRPCATYRRDPRAPRRGEAHDARVHAWQRLAR